jgi:predicted O-methyltransferase YrrM
MNLQNKFLYTEVLRTNNNDIVLRDKDFDPSCGYMSFEEISIIQKTVLGGKWLEIGSHTGWSGAHIAELCDEIYLVDPQYNLPLFKQRTIDNLKNSGVYGKCVLFSTDRYFSENKDVFDGIVIDGNHDSPYPLLDAIESDKILNHGGIIVLHDYNGQPIKDAVEYLHQQKYEISIHNTINGLAICRKNKNA